MKKLIIGLSLILSSTSLCASDIIGGGGGTRMTVLGETDRQFLDRSEIEALITRNGDYARLHDLREGFVRFRGVRVLDDRIELSEQHELDSVVLSSGEESRLLSRSGGDMGGGGKTAY